MNLSVSRRAQAIYLHFGERQSLTVMYRSSWIKEFGVKRSKQPNTTGYYSVSFWILGFCFDYTKAGSGKNL